MKKQIEPMEYMHREHGYIVTYNEMIQIMKEDYDADDTNVCNWQEYFVKFSFNETGQIVFLKGE